MMELDVKARRDYKDTLFRMIFREKDNLLSLYNAMSGKNYTNPEQLEIVTLENAIYMNMKNDLAFVIDSCLHMYEHQSTKEKMLSCFNSVNLSMSTCSI